MNMKNTKYGYIPEIKNGVVFSDPWYDKSVWCQYRKNFSAKDWLMKMESEVQDGFVTFNLYIGRPTMFLATKVNELEDGACEVKYPSRYLTKGVEIGMDTACIYCGAKEYFSEEAAIHTGTDGFFGDLMVFTNKGEKDPAGFLLMGGIDEMFASEEKLFAHICSSFDGKIITPEIFAQKTDSKSFAFKALYAKELSAAASYRQSQEATRGDNTPER